MSNAAIFFASDAFDTQRKLMGRQAAGESFLRGFLRHADVERFYFWNWSGEAIADTQALIDRIEPTAKPCEWIARQDFTAIEKPGCLFISSPANAAEAWNRRLIGPKRYSICGLTHTISSQGALDGISDLLTSPVEPWDALICTSDAVRASAANLLDANFRYLRERFGDIAAPPIRLETIPLGVNTGDFERSDAHRARWRKQLGIPDDALAVLYMGRFSSHAKMNPVPMAMALERAARKTGKEIHWILAGWAHNDRIHAMMEETPAKYAPSVKAHLVDGRDPEARFSIWSAADIFFSLSDNIQETYGLTPVEAMAAGLPAVISDWDGYRDTVRHGVDGFRIPTFMPRPTLGSDMAVQHANGWLTYDQYIGRASMFISVDIPAAADALAALFENESLRRKMGAAAQQRARLLFDWRAVIAAYQALWGDLAAVRAAAPDKPPGRFNPARLEPFSMFSSYPTRALGRPDRVSLTPGTDRESVRAMLRDFTVYHLTGVLPGWEEIEAMVAALEAGPRTVAEVVDSFPANRQGWIERTLLWLTKFGLAELAPSPSVNLK